MPLLDLNQDYTFIGVDLAQIEARGTGWLANEQKFLELFTTSDPYCTYGKSIFGYELDKKKHPIQRTASKASLLSLGFKGGIGAYQRVGENYKIDFRLVAEAVLPTATAQEKAEGFRNYKYYMDKKPLKPLSELEGVAVDILKQRYRRDFAKIEAYWDVLEQAFLYGGWANKIHVEVKASGLRVLTLPSGRQLFYHSVVLRGDGRYSYQDTFGTKYIWSGVLIENCAQALNADISDWYKERALAIAPIVHHCYDEFTLLVPKRDAESAMLALKNLTQNSKPEFCQDLPLGFDYWECDRYGK
jgi:hypothetical protein